MLWQFAGSEGGPVGGVGNAFAVGGGEVEVHRELAFAEGGVLFEIEAVFRFTCASGDFCSCVEFFG